VVAADAASGAIRWRRDLAQDYKSRFAASPGCGMSPLAAGSRVIVPTGAREGARLVSFDAATGATQWAASALLNSLNGAPGFATIDGTPAVLYHSGKPPGIGGVSAVNPDTGAELWHADMPEGISETVPVLTPHGLLLHGWSGSTMFGPVGRGAAPAVRWTSKDLTAQWAPAITVDTHIYGFGGNSGDFLLCVDAATGATAWSERIYRGHIARAGNTLVVLSESSGLLRLVAPDPSGYRELTRLDVLKPGARTRTPPSLAPGRIFVRNLEEIVAIDAR
jgi:outer membrane protein assembly factor BamB